MSETLNIKHKSLFNEILILIKYRLSLSVVISSVASYLLAFEIFSPSTFILLIIGGFLVVGSSNGFNQIIERERDSLMSRTLNRPLPSGNMSIYQAIIICSIIGLVGLSMLYAINFRTAFFGFVSMIIYLAVYTPLKPITPLSVFFGAIPGAIPFMLGWVAVTNKFSIETGILFMIQFFWQFPHFWAIGWFLHKDYQKAGFNMLPTGKRDKGTALQSIIYTAWTVLISIVPVFGFTGSLRLSILAAILVFVCGLLFLYYGLQLFKYQTEKAARQLMLASVVYITSIQIIYVLDKFIRLWI